MNLISIIIPCYNEEQAIPIFYNEIKKYDNIKDAMFEYIFVDDGSNDNTVLEIEKLLNVDCQVKYISFSRNFGKEAAILAGMEASKGEYVVIMDVDLQDPPSLLPKMYDLLCNSDKKYDCVATRRSTRKGEPIIRSFFARCFYRIINKISKTEIIDGARDFRMMSRKVVNSILSLNEYNRFSKGIFGWVGFNVKWLEYENISRSVGTSKWSFWKLFMYSIEGIVAFSTIPLAIASIVGCILCIISVTLIILIIVKTLLFGDPVGGWPSLACLILFLGGCQLLASGVIGQYVSKIYLETKNRPIYIVNEKRGFNE